MADFQYKVYKDHDDVDYTFMMKLGDYEFKSYITMWSNEYNEISKEIEQLIYEGSSVISIDFDLSPTKLVVNRQVVSLRVRVEPSDHHKIEPRYYTDYVEEKEFIRTLYDGLLLGTIFCYDEVGCGWNWFYCKMVRYNMMKSRTIEEYLRTSVAEHHKNYVCKHILIYDGKEILHICDETIGYHIPLSDKMDVYDKSGNAIAHINGEMIRNQEFHFIAESLPYDFDFWVIDVDDEGFISSKRIERIAPNNGQVFIKQEEQYEELGQDPYGFTSKTLWHACTDLDAERILHFLSLNADTTYLFKWILNSNKGGTTSSIGEPTYEESEESMRLRDNKKSEILETILNTFPYLSLTERHMDLCAWNYCQACLKVLLEHGANPNEGKFFDDWQFYAVKYRSPLNRVNTMIEDGEEKYGIQHEMKNVLESYGAKDVIIWNEEYGKR